MKEEQIRLLHNLTPKVSIDSKVPAGHGRTNWIRICHGVKSTAALSDFTALSDMGACVHAPGSHFLMAGNHTASSFRFFQTLSVPMS